MKTKNQSTWNFSKAKKWKIKFSMFVHKHLAEQVFYIYCTWRKAGEIKHWVTSWCELKTVAWFTQNISNQNCWKPINTKNFAKNLTFAFGANVYVVSGAVWIYRDKTMTRIPLRKQNKVFGDWLQDHSTQQYFRDSRRASD